MNKRKKYSLPFFCLDSLQKKKTHNKEKNNKEVED